MQLLVSFSTSMCLNLFYLACGASCHNVNVFLKSPIGQDSADVVLIVRETNHKSKKNRIDRRTKGEEACKGKGKLSSSEGSS